MTADWFPHWIHKGHSEGLVSKVEELLLQDGLRDVLFHLLKGEIDINLLHWVEQNKK